MGAPVLYASFIMPDGDVEIRFEVNTDESVKEYNNAYKVENKKISERDYSNNVLTRTIKVVEPINTTEKLRWITTSLVKNKCFFTG